MPGRTFTPEFKLQIAREVESGLKRPSQVCREHNLDESVLSRWRQQYRDRGEDAFKARSSTAVEPSAEARIAELERFVGQLSLENALLKKALANSTSKHGSK